ncbi:MULTISPECIES: 2Fe-2S iron-sulfur cluster-binding protein [Actinosynnema]|uniref:2Fe-2S iron-sulfur cluster-binding protein n=1 Tax=Actinosynnema TaxID=40566 RepID=UPI0020A60A09|nr:2Fe-2S iron-sulfur cluster-binding protein [Actinosynnema pretiosum]MCP2092293.1 Ferredoxin-NADP reductase [Actinosynnema pretiosum]
MRSEAVDTVVIGSGMGGMAVARALAEFGERRVLVLEQHYVLGGMTHEFSRDGRFRFNTGLHYLAAAEPFLDYLTDGRLQYAPMPHDYDVLHFPDHDFAVPASLDDYRERLQALFPDEAPAIARYFAEAADVASALQARNDLVMSPDPDLAAHEERFPDVFRTVDDHLAARFENPRLRQILAARSDLYGPTPDRAAFGYHAMVAVQYYGDGGTHPVGGSGEVSRLALDGLRRHGVELRTRQRVLRVLTDGPLAVGVEVLDTATDEVYEVRARTVVSDAGHHNTYRLLGLPAPLRAEGGRSCLVLFLGFERSPAELGLRGENHSFVDADGGSISASFTSLTNPAARHHTAEVLVFVDPSTVDRWRDGKDEAYEQFKRDTTRRVLDRLDARWPGLSDAVAFAELATPLTFETYQNSHRGVFYGLPATPERLREPLAGPRTPFDGLLITGQDAEMPGVVGALGGGLRVASMLLPPERTGALWERIANPVPAPGDWQGHLRVAAIDPLTPDTKLIRLEPLGGGELPFAFAAGQYLTLELPVAVDPISRSYSICSDPASRDFVEIAVKREPRGLGSVHLNDEVVVGQALRATGPLGDFTCDVTEDPGPLLLVAGGIGITPLLSVLRAAATAGHTGRITLLAAHRGQLPFAAELPALRDRLPGLEVVLFPSGGGKRIDADALRPHAAGVGRVHLCGPAPMMRDVLGALADVGVPRERVRTEAFVSGESKRTRLERAHAIALAAEVDEYLVTMPDDGVEFPCRPGETLLAAAGGAKVDVPRSCEEGVCGSCRVRVLSGPSDSDTGGMFSTAEVDAGWRLACQTLPTGDLVVTR